MENDKIKVIMDLVLKVLGVAMSVAVVVLNILDNIDVKSSLIMLGIGLFCVSLSNLPSKKQ